MEKLPQLNSRVVVPAVVTSTYGEHLPVENQIVTVRMGDKRTIDMSPRFLELDTHARKVEELQNEIQTLKAANEAQGAELAELRTKPVEAESAPVEQPVEAEPDVKALDAPPEDKQMRRPRETK